MIVFCPDDMADTAKAAGAVEAGADDLVNDALKAKFQNTFPPEAVDNIKWYPPVPAGLPSQLVTRRPDLLARLRAEPAAIFGALPSRANPYATAPRATAASGFSES